MVQENKNSQNGEPDDELDTLFRKARKTERNIDISQSETKKAFRQVMNKTQSKGGQKKFRHWKWFVAAAVVAFIFTGITILVSPKQVAAPIGKNRIVTLPDGSKVTLSGGSTLDYPRWFSLRGRTVSLHGEAFFDVKHTGTPFEVKAGQGRVIVLGTKFDVRYWPREHNYKTSVYLKEGQIKFSSIFHKNDPIILKPGEYSWISGKHSKPVHPQKVDASKAMAWLHHGISFTDQPLSVVFGEISRRFEVNIKMIPAELGKEKLTLYLSHVKNAERPIADICRAKNLKYKKKGDTYIITKSF
jgi:ferric-dicitrate binding protein FerR (iron transport regulator)